MRHFLGIDIGSYSSKGVLLDEAGTILATVQRKHDMSVPGPGLAECPTGPGGSRARRESRWRGRHHAVASTATGRPSCRRMA